MAFDPERLSNSAARQLARELLAAGFEIRVERAWPPLFRIRGHGITLTTHRLYGTALRDRIREHRMRADAARMG